MRLPTLTVALLVLAMGLVASLVTAAGQAQISALVDPPGGVVRSITPGSAEWRAGIRPGQSVMSLRSADEPGGWAVTTTDGSATFGFSQEALASEIRDALPLAAAGIALSLLALLLAFGNPRRSQGASVIGLVSASAALLAAPGTLTGALVGLASVLVPAAVVSRWLGRWPGRVLFLLATTVAVAWLAARMVVAVEPDFSDASY